MLFTPSNCLSMLRGFLVFFFISKDPWMRSLAILLAMITDSLDGYLARRWKMTSAIGAVLDPVMDKFFVLSVASIFIYEQQLEIWQVFALISRDFAVLIFGISLKLRGTWSHFKFQSIWVGKITTTIQFFVLLGLIFHITIPAYVFIFFIVLGFLALIELYIIESQLLKKSNE